MKSALIGVLLWTQGATIGSSSLVGKQIPESELLSPTGETFKLKPAFQGRPGVILFYPGGWDPYSVKLLKDFRNSISDLSSLRCHVIAVCPELPSHIEKTLLEHDLPFVVLFDAGSLCAEEFGLNQKVTDELLERKKKFGINLQSRTGQIVVHLPKRALVWVKADASIAKIEDLSDSPQLRSGEDLISTARWLLAKVENEDS
ncbi:MAG: redoxin domain-containing protein [Verrucomicrobiota bacterium]